MKQAVRLSAILAVALISLGSPGHAQAPAAPVISGPPDVLVIVYQQPGSADQVDVTYSKTVPHAQAAQDMKALALAAGWPLSLGTIKDAAAPMQSRSGLMTSIVFQVPGVIQDSTHTFPVETFARAFHAYKRLNMVFFVGPQFQFQGARTYADKDIKMALNQQGTTFVYQVEILNPNFGRLPLASQAASSAGHAGRSAPWRILLGILAAAALAGLLVYFLTARLTPRPEAAHLTDSNDQADTRLEVGTKG